MTTNVGNIYGAFKTNEKVETEGVLLDYGKFRVRIARAGGSNKRFQKVLEAKTRPYQRAIKTETMDNEVSSRILREVYIETVILSWETKVPTGEGKSEEWTKQVALPDGELVPATKENISRVLEALPDILLDIQDMSTKMALFREEVVEANGKN